MLRLRHNEQKNTRNHTKYNNKALSLIKDFNESESFLSILNIFT